MLYDVFICHASEDKESFVRPLAEALKEKNVEVWYDEFSLKLGDSIRQSLDRGLLQSRFGVVVLSKNFFNKAWPKYELDGLAEREMTGRDKVILPIWHDITHADIMKYSPSLAGRKAVSSSQGIDKVISEILDVIHPKGSPLIIARDYLLEWGVKPPVITDEYWLNVVEASNRSPGMGTIIPEEAIWGRWSFPLPYKENSPEQWGEKLALTAMQLEWVKTAETIPITPLTRPEQVLIFIDNHPGLFETCSTFPELLAEYAPQLTIPGMGGILEQVIEKEYQKSCESCKKKRENDSQYGSSLTINKKTPLCEEVWSLRHPTFGDYDPVYITSAYFRSGMFGPSISPYEEADHLFWLLSEACDWLPEKIHSILIAGMKNWHAWPWSSVNIDQGGDWKSCGALSNSLYKAANNAKYKFSWSDEINDDVSNRIRLSRHSLNLPDSVDDILQRFIDHQFPKYFLQSEKRLQRKRSS